VPMEASAPASAPPWRCCCTSHATVSPALIAGNNPAGPISRLPRSCTSIPTDRGRVSRRVNDTAILRTAVDGELP
jgi:hypothetical protein